MLQLQRGEVIDPPARPTTGPKSQPARRVSASRVWQDFSEQAAKPPPAMVNIVEQRQRYASSGQVALQGKARHAPWGPPDSVRLLHRRGIGGSACGGVAMSRGVRAGRSAVHHIDPSLRGPAWAAWAARAGRGVRGRQERRQAGTAPPGHSVRYCAQLRAAVPPLPPAPPPPI